MLGPWVWHRTQTLLCRHPDPQGGGRQQGEMYTLLHPEASLLGWGRVQRDGHLIRTAQHGPLWSPWSCCRGRHSATLPAGVVQSTCCLSSWAPAPAAWSLTAHTAGISHRLAGHRPLSPGRLCLARLNHSRLLHSSSPSLSVASWARLAVLPCEPGENCALSTRIVSAGFSCPRCCAHGSRQLCHTSTMPLSGKWPPLTGPFCWCSPWLMPGCSSGSVGFPTATPPGQEGSFFWSCSGQHCHPSQSARTQGGAALGADTALLTHMPFGPTQSMEE